MASDEELVDRTRAGELSAFEELVERHQAVVTRVASRITGVAEADDVAQGCVPARRRSASATTAVR